MQLVIVGLYFALLLGAGLVRKWFPKGEADFLLAGRQVTLLPFIATLVSTSYGWILGVGQVYAELGVSAWFVLSFPYTVGTLLLALFFAKRARKQEFVTLSDLLDRQYGKTVSTVGTLLFVLVCLPSMYLLMAGQVLNFLTNWGMIFSLVAVAVFSSVYLYAGGLKTLIKTDILQFVLMFGGFGMLLVVLVNTHGWEMLNNLPAQKLNMEVDTSLWYIISWFLLAAFTLIDPNFYQRIYAVNRPQTARTGLLLSVLIWTIFDFLAGATALYGLVLLPESNDHTLIYLELGASQLSPALAGLFFVALLSAIMSTADSLIFYSSVTLAKDFFHRNDWLKRIPLQKLTRFCLFGVTLGGLLICLPYRHGSSIDLFFDLFPITVSALLIPVLTAYFPRWNLNPGWSLLQILSSALVCTLYMVFQKELSTEWEILATINGVYPGLAVSLLIYLIGIWNPGPQSQS
ncbi:MAG: sodium:solute symporter family protein [Bacteroidia bacterium]|nr:sodium:solute symporter family protein [Bacteroidia bacterium]